LEKVFFANTWETYFSKAGLLSFEDFFYNTNGQLIGKNEKREVITFHAGNSGENKQFFLKCFNKPHLKDIFFTWRGSGRLCSQGRYEWDCANFLIQSGIETYKPVCYGEQTKLGLERKSFFITEKLPGQCMTDFVTEKWQDLERQEKERIIKDLGVFIRKIHDLKINFPDLYLWHIFLRQKEGQWEFAIIDLHRMVCNVSNTNKQLKNLGRFDHSMTDKYFDSSMRRLFLESYAGRDWPGGIDKLQEKVKKYSDTISSRRKPLPY
jgi:hypothetical protein